jgi:hypothetical protein
MGVQVSNCSALAYYPSRHSWLAPGSETEQGLERGHGLPAPIVAKDEFIKINLKLIAAHAVVGSDQPLLEIPNGAAGATCGASSNSGRIEGKPATEGTESRAGFGGCGERLSVVIR